MKATIFIAAIISVITHIIIRPAYALAPEGCSITVSPAEVNYGDITSERLYNEAVKNGENFVLTKNVTLNVSCNQEQTVTVDLRSPQADSEYDFNAGHGARVALTVDKITTDGRETKSFIFESMRGHTFNALQHKEWRPGHVLSSDHRLQQMAVDMSVKLTLPSAILQKRTAADIYSILNFHLKSKVVPLKDILNKKHNH